MMYKTIFFIMSVFLTSVNVANAQLSAQKDAAYFAVVKAVADYKINDEENQKQVQQLREDKKFNDKLKKMMEKLDNAKSKNATNRRIYNILRQAGKQIYDELD
ncbi:MAG: hypothetical protein E7016_02670 [Alphaproteobacteria bacterium]|nr:hypothetical protein [Alphaproteobacteria bacterium]